MSKTFRELNEVLNTIMRNDISPEEMKMIEKMRAERKAREAQQKTQPQSSGGARSFQDRRDARRSSSPDVKANRNSQGQSIKVGSPTGPAQNDQLKKSAPTPAANTPAPKPPTAQERAVGPRSTLNKDQQAVNREYDRLRKTDPEAAAVYGKKMAARGAAKKDFKIQKPTQAQSNPTAAQKQASVDASIKRVNNRERQANAGAYKLPASATPTRRPAPRPSTPTPKPAVASTRGTQQLNAQGARQSVGVNESKKTFSQFVVEAHNLNEALPLAIPAALKLGSMALSAYSAYKAGQNLKKGNYKQAAWDATGVIPGGAVFKGVRALGAGKRLAQAGSLTQSVARNFGPGARAQMSDKIAGKVIDGAVGAANAMSKPSSRPKSQSSAPKPTPAARPKTTVLAKKGGVQGTLDKSTGKFTAKNWSDAQSSRYKAHGGK